MLMKFLSDVRDNRSRQGLRYELVRILIFSIFAVLSGADSYRKIHMSHLAVRYRGAASIIPMIGKLPGV